MAVLLAKASSECIFLGAGVSLMDNVPGLTISAWVRLTSIDATERYVIYCSTNAGATTARAHMAINTAGNFHSNFRRLDADASSTLSTTFTASINTTYHLVLRARYTTGGLDYWVNGAQDNTLAIAGWNGNSSATTNLNANIGGRGNNGSQTNHWDGTIDDVMIFPRALADSEIRALYHSRGSSRFIGQNRWLLDELAPGNAVATAVDVWGGINGSGINTPTYTGSLTSMRARGYL